jgi:hypothetical protein
LIHTFNFSAFRLFRFEEEKKIKQAVVQPTLNKTNPVPVSALLQLTFSQLGFVLANIIVPDNKLTAPQPYVFGLWFFICYFLLSSHLLYRVVFVAP